MKFRTALPWAATILAAAAIVLSAVSLCTTASTAENMRSIRPVATSTVVPGVFPTQDHIVSWDRHISPREQILFQFGSQEAADEAGDVASSTAWNPAADQRQPVLIAWEACQTDGHDNFSVSKKWNGQITASDCTKWWNGDDTRLEAFRGW